MGPGKPGDELLRPTTSQVLVAGSNDPASRNQGKVYTFDRSNDRVLAYDKRSGDFIAQYRLKDSDAWGDLRAMYIIPGVGGQPDKLVWLSKDGVNETGPRGRAGCRWRLAVALLDRQRLPVDLPEPIVGALPRDPAPRREPDPAYAGRHPRDHRRLRAGLRLPGIAPGSRWRIGARGVHHPMGRGAGRARRRPAGGAFASAEALTLVTSQFLHGSLVHIAREHAVPVDLREQHRGPLRAAAVPGLLPGRGIVAGLTQVAIDPTSTVPTIGASGAIAAILGAYLVLFPGARVTTADLPDLLLSADRDPGDLRTRLLVRATAVRRPRVARRDGSGDDGRCGLLRPYRRVHLRGGRRAARPDPRRQGAVKRTGRTVG